MHFNMFDIKMLWVWVHLLLFVFISAILQRAVKEEPECQREN